MLVPNHDDLALVGRDLQFMFYLVAGLTTVLVVLVVCCEWMVSRFVRSVMHIRSIDLATATSKALVELESHGDSRQLDWLNRMPNALNANLMDRIAWTQNCYRNGMRFVNLNHISNLEFISSFPSETAHTTIGRTGSNPGSCWIVTIFAFNQAFDLQSKLYSAVDLLRNECRCVLCHIHIAQSGMLAFELTLCVMSWHIWISNFQMLDVLILDVGVRSVR